jgi:hypothetical protein
MSKLTRHELKSISHKQLRAEALAEMCKHTALLEAQTTLLEVIAKQGEQTAQYRDQVGKWPLFLTPAEVAAGVCRHVYAGTDTGGLPG